MNVLLAAGVLALGIALAGCGGDDGNGNGDEGVEQLDPNQVDRIEKTLESALADPGAFDEPGADVQAVECPAEIDQTAGEEFRCEVRRSDGEGVVTVTLVDERGTDISYEAEVAGATITGRQDVVE